MEKKDSDTNIILYVVIKYKLAKYAKIKALAGKIFKYRHPYCNFKNYFILIIDLEKGLHIYYENFLAQDNKRFCSTPLSGV